MERLCSNGDDIRLNVHKSDISKMVHTWYVGTAAGCLSQRSVGKASVKPMPKFCASPSSRVQSIVMIYACSGNNVCRCISSGQTDQLKTSFGERVHAKILTHGTDNSRDVSPLERPWPPNLQPQCARSVGLSQPWVLSKTDGMTFLLV